MHLRLTVTAAVLSLASLTACGADPSTDVRPSVTLPPALTVPAPTNLPHIPAAEVEDADPSPDECYETGNYICGPANKDFEAAGWQVWQRENGAAKLKVDPSRPYVVRYNGTARHYPTVTDSSAVVAGIDGLWHVFTAVYTD